MQSALEPPTTSAGGLLFSTYLGGPGDDIGFGVAIDNSLSVYVTGQTNAVGFPITADGFSGSTDVFVTKLKFDGTALLYSRVLGGAGDDAGRGIAVLGTDAFVVGSTSSGGFPVTGGAFDTTWNA